MGERTGIEWTDHTWSPWEGCTRVSVSTSGGGGCDHCYAERMNRWLRKGENWGPGAPRREYSEDHWEKPIRWNAAAAKLGETRKVFPSVCDPFDNEVDRSRRIRFFRLIQQTPHLTWQLLTKRIGNAAAMLQDTAESLPGMMDAHDRYRPLPNLWLGATVVNQDEADRDIPKLLKIPAAVRFLSIEPMLGPIDLTNVNPPNLNDGNEYHGFDVLTPYNKPLRPQIDWVIAGGESGPNARPAHPDWFRSLRDQCAAAGVPFLFKQHGEWLPINQQDEAFTSSLYRSRRKAEPHQDQGAVDELYGKTCTVPRGCVRIDGSFHEMSEPGAFLAGTTPMTTYKVGKHRAGRKLDGRTHDEFPSIDNGAKR